jgi:hypothetical protein
MYRRTGNEDLLGDPEEVFSGERGARKMIGVKPQQPRHEHDYVDNNGDSAPETISVGGLTMRLKDEPTEERGWITEQRQRELENRRRKMHR